MADDDKVSAAFDAAAEALSEPDRKARMAYWRDLSEEGYRRDYLEQITHDQSR